MVGFVLGRAGRFDNRRIDQRALLHQHAALAEPLIDRLEHTASQLMLL
ncbi:Uncharacterised protein [Vibrio cholerae]|nr:Uncharacterised protein [Vibrio cholerae]